jgi:hypothetical protein
VSDDQAVRRPATPTHSATGATSAWATRLERWILPVTWLVLPLVVGPSFQATLEPRADLFRSAVSAALWVVWGVALGATLIPRTVTLTGLRIVTPATVVASAWAVAATPHLSTKDAVALGYVVVVALVSFAPSVGQAYINGSAYGLERRLPLRPPAALVLGPLELAWAAVVAGTCAGPLLLADRQWVLGGVLVLVGWPVAGWTVRSLHILARRWLVYTPAGLVLHDQLAVVESLLVIRRHLDSIGPALAGTDARDLTLGAFGLALEIDLTEPLPFSPSPRRRLRTHDEVVSEDIESFLFTPTRPGLVLAEAAERRLPRSS